MTDKEFLTWIYSRLTFVYDEDPKVDYMVRLKSYIDTLEDEESLNAKATQYNTVFKTMGKVHS